MPRIVAVDTLGGGANLSLEGRGIGPCEGNFPQSCEPILATRAALTVDLAEVAFVERGGMRRLSHRVAGGVTVVNCPALVSEQLKTL